MLKNHCRGHTHVEVDKIEGPNFTFFGDALQHQKSEGRWYRDVLFKDFSHEIEDQKSYDELISPQIK